MIVRAHDSAWALWARYQLLARPALPLRASVWGVGFARDHRVARVDDDRGPRALAAQPFVVESAGGRLTAASASGALAGLAWDLRWSDADPASTVLPWGWMLTGAFPRMKIASPVPRAVAAGAVEIAGERVDAAGASVLVGHTWGTAHAHRWAWLHVPLPDGVFEAVRAVPFRGAPALTAASLRLGGRTWRLAGPRTLLAAPSRERPVAWSFTTAGAGASVRVEASAPDKDVVALEYVDPSGGRRVCHGCERARARLVVRAGGEERVFEAPASLELGLPDAAPGVAPRLVRYENGSSLSALEPEAA